MMFGQGNGAPKDDNLALHWALQAAEQGSARLPLSRDILETKLRPSVH
jgi:TPR repeat protein